MAEPTVINSLHDLIDHCAKHGGALCVPPGSYRNLEKIDTGNLRIVGSLHPSYDSLVFGHPDTKYDVSVSVYP